MAKVTLNLSELAITLREHDNVSNPQNRSHDITPPPSGAPIIGLLADGRIVVNMTLNDKEGIDDLVAKLNALRVIAPGRPQAEPQQHSDETSVTPANAAHGCRCPIADEARAVIGSASFDSETRQIALKREQ